MKSLWNDSEAKSLRGDLLKLRVYTSRLLGREPDLVLHGGGNTSVKIREKNLFGEEEELLYVKGSGWDLATIEGPGFAPVKMKVLLQMAELETLSDEDMVKHQRAAMTNPSAPNPSVEAIMHALFPFIFVDHTHADAVVTISNTENGEDKIRGIYGDSVLVVPYVMPGFILAKEIYRRIQNLDWKKIEGMILLNHGVFTFHDDPRVSYERMIEMVTRAENYLGERGAVVADKPERGTVDPHGIARIRKAVSVARGKPVLTSLDNSEENTTFSNMEGVGGFATRGPITPDHVIRTKRIPVILNGNSEKAVKGFVEDYQKYFEEFKHGSLVSLDPAPRWGVWPGHGTLAFGVSWKEVGIIRDICQHTIKAIRQGEMLGGWKALPKNELFELEYWTLEQAKLKKGSSAPPMQGKIALVTGAASGIGKACVMELVSRGAVVGALDINPEVVSMYDSDQVLGLECDVTDTKALTRAVESTVGYFGGLDMLVSNAGTFPKSKTIGEMDSELWDKSLDINLTSHQKLLNRCLPYLELGMDPAVVIIGSKNVPAPGPGASAYSVAKAGVTQLARVAALEFGKMGIRVNIVHPNAVFDTGIWPEDVLEERAANYGLSVEEYKTNNVLKVEVSSQDVAGLAITMLGSTFSKTTGAQIPIDGGNERVI